MHTTDIRRASAAATVAVTLVAFAVPAYALPGPQDRVYTADQNSNTVSVIDPSTNTLLGQIRLGNARPDVLSPLYKGEVNVHGLGFSPDHKTLLVVSNGSNSATFIDTATNKVKGVAYIGRSPHEGFFTIDGREAWVVVRGEDYISVIDPATFREKRRIQTTGGPGMVLFHPNGRQAFVVSSFNPTVDVIDVKSHKVVKHIPVTSPFSPFLQFTPDHKEVWMTHKDVGKVTRIDTATLAVKGVIDTGFITNHLAFARTAAGVLAYVTVGGENVVKVFSTGDAPALVASIPTGALPHGIWSSDDSSRVYVGLENEDAVEVGAPGTGLCVESGARREWRDQAESTRQQRTGQHRAQTGQRGSEGISRCAQPGSHRCAGGHAAQAEAEYSVQRVCQRPGHAVRQFQDQCKGHGHGHSHWPNARDRRQAGGQAAQCQPDPCHGRRGTCRSTESGSNRHAMNPAGFTHDFSHSTRASCARSRRAAWLAYSIASRNGS
jgi:YVTN family beta-propeller protein